MVIRLASRIGEVSQEQKHPWERMPGEPGNAWRYFQAYLDLPAGSKRTVRAAYASAQALDVTPKRCPSIVFQYAAEWQWDERASAYDSHCAAERAEFQRESVNRALDKTYIALEDYRERLHQIACGHTRCTREQLAALLVLLKVAGFIKPDSQVYSTSQSNQELAGRVLLYLPDNGRSNESKKGGAI